MLGSVVYQVLAGYLGHYVKDMQREQFRIGLWSGEVLLENVDLRLEAFDSLQLPLSIKQASIGKLRILVPWKKLGWEPILISLEDVTIRTSPQDDGVWDAEASERRELAAKKAALASAEIAKFSKCVSETKSGQSFLSNFFGKIIDNVQVVVKNVHIQYVDRKTDPEVMSLVGLKLSALTVSTSDASFAGSAGGGKVRGSQEHKVIEIKRLAMYWNPQSHPLGGSLEAKDNQIISVLKREEDTTGKVVYLLSPTDVTLKLLLNKNVTGEDGVAQYAVVINVDDLSLALEDLQLRGMLLLFNAISIARAREKYGRFRPQASEGNGSPNSEWKTRLWQYSIDAVLSDVRKTLWRRSLGYLVWRRAYRERYVDLYIDKLENLQRGQPSGEEESAELEEIERQFDMDEILFFRSLAEREMPLEDIFGNAAILEDESSGGAEGPTTEDLLTPEPVLQQKGWLNWLSLGLLGAADHPDAGQTFPQEIIKDLYEAAKLHPMPLLDSGELSKGQCHLAVTLHVGELLGSLHSSKLGQDILIVSVQGIAMTAQMWIEKITVSVMVRTLEVVDLCTPGTRYPRILAPWGKLTPRASQRKPARRSYAEALAGSGLVRSVSEGSMSTLQGSVASDEDGSSGEKSEPLLRVEFELQPKRSDHDLTITVVLQPVEFVYSETLLKRATSFFSFPASQEVLNDQVEAALKKLEDVAVKNFKHKVVERKRLRLLLDIRRPNFLFPESSLTSNGILMILAVDSVILASQELKYALEDASSKGLSRTAILRRHIGVKHGIFPNIQGQNGRNQDVADIPLDKCGHYDRFQLRLTGAQVLISGNSGDWHETLNSHEADMEWHLVKRFNLQVATDICIKEDLLLPRLKIHGYLPALRLHFSLGKCRAVNDLLSKLFVGSQLNKGAVNSSTSPRPSQVADGNSLFTWEMNLKLKVVTVELSLDSERHDSPTQMEKNLVAQVQEMNITCVQRSSRADLELLIKTVHVEDGSELASSPFRYLLFCAGCHRSTSPRPPIVDTKPVLSSSAESLEKKYAVCLKTIVGGPKGVPTLGVMAALHGLEFHINPKVFRALHVFALAATTPKASASGISQSLTTISDTYPDDFPSDIQSPDDYYVDSEETGLRSVFSGLPIKSPVHNQLQANAQSPTSSHPSGSVPSDMNFEDGGNHAESKDKLLFFFEKLTCQLLPLCAMFQNQVARHDSVIIDVQLESCGIHFLDAGGTVGVVLLPDATICTSIPCAASSGEESWEIVAVSSDLQLKGTHWASGNINEDPVGSLTCGPTATWDFRVRKSEKGNLDVVFQIHNAQIVLLPDYLAGLIQYFDSSHWISPSKSNVRSVSKSSTICWKVEVEDSVLFLPRVQGKNEFAQLVLGEFLFTTVDDHSPTSSYYFVGQKVSVRVHGTDGDCDDRPDFDLGKSSCGHTLVDRWDGELFLDVPPGSLPTCVEIHSSILELVLDGNAFVEQVEAFEFISEDLSDIEWTLNTIALTTVHGGLCSWIPGKHVHVHSPSTGSLNLKFCALKLCIAFATPATGIKSLPPAAVLQVDTIDADISANQGILEALSLEVLSIVLFSFAPKLKLLQCKGVEELATQPTIKLLVTSEGPESEVHISLPSTQVWLHVAAWSAVAPVLAAILKQGNTHTASDDAGLFDRAAGSSKPPPKVEILVLQEDLDSSFSPPQDTHPMNARTVPTSSSVGIHTSRHVQSKNATVLVKVGTFRLALLVLDYPSKESERVVEDEDPSFIQGILPGKLISCTLALRVDEFRFNKDGTWTLAAGITHGEGNAVETFENQDAFQELCFQASEISVSVDGSFQMSPVVRFNLKLNADCINFWCSYPILLFFRRFTFEELEPGSPHSLDTEGKAEICLQHASVLLSDGRWSCKAPIVELLLGNIIAQASHCAQKLEVSLSSDLEANYHNMHKVSWEPLVEPWSVSSILTFESASGASKSQDSTRIKVSSSANLNINVTESLVQAVSRAAEMAHDAWADDATARDTRLGNSSQYAPYWLQNDTGVAITFWLIGSRHNRDDVDDEDGGFGGWGTGSGTVVEAGKSAALYQQGSAEEISSRKRNSGLLRSAGPAKMFEVLLQHRMICVQIEGTSRPSPPLSIDLVGSRSFEASFSENESGCGFNSSANNTPGNLSRENSFQKLDIDNRDKGDVFRTPVVFEVTIQRYSKLVRLCSTVSVVNLISVPLEVRFDIPFTISPKVMEPVLPGQVMPLPVHLAQTGKIRWRPLGNKYVWSEVQSIGHLLQSSESTQGLHRPVLCYPNSRTSRPFRCCLSVSHCPIAAVDSNFGELTQDPLDVGRVPIERPKEFKLWDISLQAPLVVKNCLPLPVSVTIDSGTGITVSHTAPEGNSKFIHDVDTVHNLCVTFRVRAFVTSSAIILQAAQAISESSRRSDKEGRIRAVETVNLYPEIMSDPVVAAEVEYTINMISGTREICLSVPFWLYNCSYFNLAVIDGDVDAFSGRQKYLAKVSTESCDKEKQQTDTRPGLAILQASEQQAGEISFGWFPKRGVRFISQRKTLSNSKLITADSQESTSSKGDVLDDYWKLLVPHMYSPVKGTESSEHRLRARVVHPVHIDTRNSIEQSWSRPFSVDIPDGTTTVTVPRPQKLGAYVFSVVCNPVLGSGAGKSKTVTFRPRYLVANSCSRDLCVKQQGTDAFERLPVGQHCHLHWTDLNRALLVSVRFNDHGWDWSGGFAPDQLGDTQVKVRNHTSGATQMLRVEVSNMTPSDTSASKGVSPGIGNLGTCLILLSDDETGFMPYRIDNFSMERIRFHQQKCEKMENILHPYCSFCYAWDEPCDPHRLVLEIPGGGPLGVYGLDEVKEYSPITLLSTSQKPERTFIVSVRAEGPIRVLSVADTSLHLMKTPYGSSSVFPSSQAFAPNSRILESTVTDTDSVTELFVDFSYIGVSLINSVPQEIIFACAKGSSLQLIQGQHQQQVKLDISVIQIDNQLRFAVYPVLLSSTYPHSKLDVVDNTSRVGKELKPSEGASVTLLIAKWRHPAGSVDCFQCISLRLVPMRLEIEEQVLSSLLGFMDKAVESFPGIKMDKLGSSKVPAWSLLRWNRFNGQDQFAGRPWKFEVVQVSTIQSREVRFRKVVKRLEEYQCWASVGAVEPVGGPYQKVPLLAKEKSKAYIEILDISPIELTVSFSSTPWLSNNSETATKNSLLFMTGMMLQHHVMAIADAEDAVMNLRRLTLAHPLASWDAIRGMITRHYTRQLLQEVYKVVGSADVLGNPIHFVRTLGSGMWDFVSTPAKSLNQSPRQLAWGLFQGTHSLFSNTVFAFSNAATRMSKVARKTVTAFAFDKDYVDKMERREHSHGMEDLSVVNEFLEGLTGLLQSPVRGAERAGLPGMLSGAAVGALGVVARPVATILEVASKTGQSIVNRSSPKQWRATRIRLPRHLREDSPLLPYSWENAVGRAVLLESDGGCFRNEVLMLCLPLAHGSQFVLLTHTRILKVSSVKVDYRSGFKWHMELVAAVEDILHMDHGESRVNILLGPARREFVRTQHYSGLGHKVMSLPAHETLEFLNENALDQFLVVLQFLEDRLQHSRSTILISTRTL